MIRVKRYASLRVVLLAFKRRWSVPKFHGECKVLEPFLKFHGNGFSNGAPSRIPAMNLFFVLTNSSNIRSSSPFVIQKILILIHNSFVPSLSSTQSSCIQYHFSLFSIVSLFRSTINCFVTNLATVLTFIELDRFFFLLGPAINTLFSNCCIFRHIS